MTTTIITVSFDGAEWPVNPQWQFFLNSTNACRKPAKQLPITYFMG